VASLLLTRPIHEHAAPAASFNQALRRPAPRITLTAADHPAAFPQPARRAPQSLSFRALAVISHVL